MKKTIFCFFLFASCSMPVYDLAVPECDHIMTNHGDYVRLKINSFEPVAKVVIYSHNTPYITMIPSAYFGCVTLTLPEKAETLTIETGIQVCEYRLS